MARCAMLLLLPVALAAGLVACGEDDAGEEAAAVISAITLIDKAGLHDFDTALSNDGKVPPTARTTAIQLQTVTLLTEWPDKLGGRAKALAAIFGDFARSLDGDSPDVKAAGAAAKKAHDAAHDFSHDVWAYLQAEAGVASGSVAHTD
jgi:hypothetical protein